MTHQSLVCAALCLALLIFTVLNVVQSSYPNTIQLKDGGYTNLLVAIHEDIPEDEALLNQLMEDFSEGSKYLFEATSNRVFWKQITFLLPMSWNNRHNYSEATHESFLRANIRVDKPNKLLPHNPYVLMTGQCGSKGVYMHLTPEYLQNSSINEQYGSLGTGRVLVHEWGHLRWGVGDEYPNMEHFYPSTQTKTIEGIRCSLNVDVEAVALDYTKCKYNLDDINADNLVMINAHCQSYDQLPSQAQSSIMYKPNILESVTQFCHNDSSRPGVHNMEAPNPHNMQCNYRSTWEVILETDDFAGGKSPPIEGHIKVEPTFKFVYRIPMRVVILIEATERLNKDDYFLRVRQALSHFIQYVVEDGIEIGIVTFGRDVSVIHPMVQITNQDSRTTLSSGLPTVGYGDVNLSTGLQKAIDVLTVAGSNVRGSSILVISGGSSSSSTDLASVQNSLINYGVTVDAVLYGTMSDIIDEDLINLVEEVQGVWLGFSGYKESCVLEDSLMSILMERADIHKDIPKQILSAGYNVSEHGVDDTVYVADYLGKDLTFTFFFATEAQLRDSQVYLNDPDGQQINVRNIAQYKVDYSTSTLTIKVLLTAQMGEWTYHMIYEGFEEDIIVRVNIMSKVKSPILNQIVINGQLMYKDLDYAKDKIQKLSVTVAEEYIFLFGADVRVVIDRPDAPPIPLYVVDFGIEVKGVFYNFTSDGIYTVSIEVINYGDSMKLFDETEEFSSKYYSHGDVIPSSLAKRFKRQTDEDEFAYVNPFTCTQLIASFRVRNYKPSLFDIHPPSQIELAEAEDTISSYKNKDVTLQWFSPGDDYYYGQASAYDIRISFQFKELVSNFESAYQITQADCVTTDSDTDINNPKQAYEYEELTVHVPLDIEQDSVVVFAIVAIDAAGNRGQRSNIVAVTFRKPNYLLVIIIVIICIVCCIILLVLVCIIRKHRKSLNSSSVQYQAANLSADVV